MPITADNRRRARSGDWSQGGVSHVQNAIEKMGIDNPGKIAQDVAKVLVAQSGPFHIGQNLSPHSPAVHVRRGSAEVRIERVGDAIRLRRVVPGAPPPEEELTEKLPANASRGQITKHVGKDCRVSTPWGAMQFYAGDDAGPYAMLPDEKTVAGADEKELASKIQTEFTRLERGE